MCLREVVMKKRVIWRICGDRRRGSWTWECRNLVEKDAKMKQETMFVLENMTWRDKKHRKRKK
jgi:hypothetical protein